MPNHSGLVSFHIQTDRSSTVEASYSCRIGLASNLAATIAITNPNPWTELGGMLLLAPDIKKVQLYLPEVTQGKATIHERLLRPLTTQLDWSVQRRMWARIRKSRLSIHITSEIEQHRQFVEFSYKKSRISGDATLLHPQTPVALNYPEADA